MKHKPSIDPYCQEPSEVPVSFVNKELINSSNIAVNVMESIHRGVSQVKGLGYVAALAGGIWLFTATGNTLAGSILPDLDNDVRPGTLTPGALELYAAVPPGTPAGVSVNITTTGGQ